MRQILFTLPLLASAAPTIAGETPWQTITSGVAIRLISTGVVTEAGKTMMALEIDMPRTTKTYWRIPGETGLPLDLDLSGSDGIVGYRVLWPYPVQDETGGFVDFVYYGHTVLPLEIEVDDISGTIEMNATLGICSDICVPAQARFSLPISEASPDRANALRIRQAVAEVPVAWDEADDPVGAVEFLPDDKLLAVEIAGSDLDPDSLIAASSDGETLFGVPQKSPQANLVLLPILGKSDNSALQGMDVELTFMTERGAYMVSRTIGAGEAPATVSETDAGNR